MYNSGGESFIAAAGWRGAKAVDLDFLQQWFVLEFFEGCGFRCPPRKGYADFLQESVTPNLSLGREVFWAGQHHKSGLDYGARYNTDKMVELEKRETKKASTFDKPPNVPKIGELDLNALMFEASSTSLNANHYHVYLKGMPSWNGKPEGLHQDVACPDIGHNSQPRISSQEPIPSIVNQVAGGIGLSPFLNRVKDAKTIYKLDQVVIGYIEGVDRQKSSTKDDQNVGSINVLRIHIAESCNRILWHYVSNFAIGIANWSYNRRFMYVRVHKDYKSPFLISGCKVVDVYGTMLHIGISLFGPKQQSVHVYRIPPFHQNMGIMEFESVAYCGHQWLIYVMSLSKGLMFKPYPGPGYKTPSHGSLP
ncbi:acyl-activating enzyme 17 [Artemisia annua]|uniref:Acyl-activating enzyme 17 n=1 Tax=Artemisia annua TaxID=35608 RepID=A0A2U1QFL4_ARTAN|nr:acyl-activating enzyme 17 [Artemisia annua]